VQGPAIEIAALDQEVGRDALGPQLPELRPEAPLDDRAVQIQHGLALDQRAETHAVVARRQRSDLHLRPQRFERPGNPAVALVDINDDSDGRLREPHGATVP
jgi:hypothetical protein